MITVFVRGKKDADAFKAMLERFYRDWNVEVKTLKGARSFENAIEELEKHDLRESFVFVILGREDEDVARGLRRIAPPNVIPHVINRAKVRNATMDGLAYEFALARAKARLGVKWANGTFRLSYNGEGAELEGMSYDVTNDVFLFVTDDALDALSSIIKCRIRNSALLVRESGGVHGVYVDYRRIASIRIPDFGNVELISSGCVDNAEGPPIDSLLRANRDIVETYESIAISFLKRFDEWADVVLVPWSGGKDSTAVLIMALTAFSRNRVVAVYAGTGFDFPECEEYVDWLSKRLGVNVVYRKAPMREELERRGELPTHDNRWCTGLKIGAIESVIKEYAEKNNVLVIVGDREAESERRAWRPPARREGNVVYVAPLKLWGTAHVQLYLALKGVELNPLYRLGFYRLGCYICPALRSWELYVMKRSGLFERLLSDPWFQKFIRAKLGD